MRRVILATVEAAARGASVEIEQLLAAGVRAELELQVANRNIDEQQSRTDRGIDRR